MSCQAWLLPVYIRFPLCHTGLILCIIPITASKYMGLWSSQGYSRSLSLMTWIDSKWGSIIPTCKYLLCFITFTDWRRRTANKSSDWETVGHYWSTEEETWPAGCGTPGQTQVEIVLKSSWINFVLCWKPILHEDGLLVHLITSVFHVISALKTWGEW